jgi:dienelactone hydrolase
VIGRIALAATIASFALTAAARAQDFSNAIKWAIPEGAAKAPVVLILEGTGGSRGVPSNWARFFVERGIAAVLIQSAEARGRRNWAGTGCELQYGRDLRRVLAILRDRPEFDASRFAVMGLSRGGTEALGHGFDFAEAPARPAAVFAFYPGCGGICAIDWPHHAPGTTVDIFYGAADEWGAHQRNRDACRRNAGGGVLFHEYEGAHHGFDGTGTGWFSAAGTSFRYAPDPAALAAAQAIVAERLAVAWGTKR